MSQHFDNPSVKNQRFLPAPLTQGEPLCVAIFYKPCYNYRNRLPRTASCPRNDKEKVKRMKKVLFVCHGNICRSPMAHYVLLDMVKKAGIADQFSITSVAVSREELGNPVYPPARRELNSHGVPCDGHRARQITQADVDGYEHIYYMDRSNLRYLERMFPGETKFRPFLSRDVADPWYTGDFTQTWADIQEGCTRIFEELK